MPGPALRMTNLDYDSEENHDYRDAVALLVSKVQACKQNKAESVDDFIHRRSTRQAPLFLREHHLCGHVFRGLRPDVAAEVKHS